MQKSAVVFWSLILFPAVVSASEMTWEDCLRAAARSNPALIAAAEDVVQAREARAIIASDVYPQLNANASASESRITPASSSTLRSHSYAYGLAASYLLFDGFQSGNNIHASQEDILAAREGFRFASADIRLQLRSAFVNLLKAQELILVTRSIASIREKQLKLISLRYRSGLEHKGALLDTRARLTQAKLELVQAVRNLVLAQRQLNRVMGQNAAEPVRAKDPWVVREKVNGTDDLQSLSDGHPKVKQALARKTAADFSLRAVRGGYFPRVSLQAGLGKEGDEWPPPDRGLSAGMTVSLPLFEGGARPARVRQAVSVLKQLEAEWRRTRDSVGTSLEQSREGLRTALESVQAARQLLAASEERSRIAEAQYSTGFISYDNWSIIEDNLVQARKSYLNARANALLAEAQWVNAKGETLEYAYQ